MLSKNNRVHGEEEKEKGIEGDGACVCVCFIVTELRIKTHIFSVLHLLPSSVYHQKIPLNRHSVCEQN